MANDRAFPVLGGVGILVIGLAMLGGGKAEARPPGRPDGTRLSTPAVATGDAYQRGKSLLAADDMPGAVAAFRAALVDDPQSVDALNGLGVAFDRLGRYDIARGYYDMALALAPDSVLVLNNLGYSLYLQGQDAAAIPFLRRALAAAVPGGPAPAQRILTLIAERMRTRAAAAETAITIAETATTIAETAAPAARIELAANGEQRLVLAAAAPEPELVAALGDAAALTVPARAWTPRDEAQVVASAAPVAPVQTAPVVVPAAPAAPAATTPAALAALPASPMLPAAPRRREDEPALAFTDPHGLAPRPVPQHPQHPHQPRPDTPPALPGAGPDDRGHAVLASLVAVSTPPQLPPALASAPPAPAAAFDSDNAELNAFAARMAAWRAAAPVAASRAAARVATSRATARVATSRATARVATSRAAARA